MEERELPAASPSAALSSFLSLCPICNKAFSQEYSFNRHVKYCQRSQDRGRQRPKSCLACRAIKTKCTFAKPKCARCLDKGISCVYDPSPSQVSRATANAVTRTGTAQVQSHSQEQAHSTAPSSWVGLDGGGGGVLTTSSGDMPSTLLEPNEIFGDLDMSLINDSSALGAGMNSLDNTLSAPVTGSYPWQDSALNVPRSIWPSLDDPFLSFPIVPSDRPAWLSDDTRPAESNTLSRITQRNRSAHHAANVIHRIVRSFPQMMLRPQTFPPLIHGQWHRKDSSLPDKITVCVCVAQLYASRTPESSRLVWKIIDSEEQKIRDNLFNIPVEDMASAVQVTYIYIIMTMSEAGRDTLDRGRRLLYVLKALTVRFQELLNGQFTSETEAAYPSTTWEEWIFAESRRRLTSLWLAISLVVFFTSGSPCPGFDDRRRLPVVSPKALWEARTREEWEAEKAMYDAGSPIMTFGELLDVRRGALGRAGMLKYEAWEAESDKMGLLLGLAADLIQGDLQQP